jgi:hypothetical protein
MMKTPKFTAREITEIIQKEIDWSNANKGELLNDKSFFWHDGFIQGLKQASLLVTKFSEAIRQDD